MALVPGPKVRLSKTPPPPAESNHTDRKKEYAADPNTQAPQGMQADRWLVSRAKRFPAVFFFRTCVECLF